MDTTTDIPVIEHIDYFEVAPGVWGLKDIFVNIYMIANQADDSWVLVDAGLKGTAKKIRAMATALFGKKTKPSCIILTHGHFDHVGSLKELTLDWKVPVYAHELELPYLTGRSSYPPPDASVGGGLLASMAWIFPTSPIQMEGFISPLPAEGEVPFLQGWKYYHTPGHAPGHISLFRSGDKVLISGDAIVTTRQESVLSVLLQSKVLSGPPKYFTYDWQQARASVNLLWMLEPEFLASGHGKPMQGHEMRQALNKLDQDFDHLAVPKHGRYLERPAKANASGVVYIPGKKTPLKNAIGVGIIVYCVYMLFKKKRKKS